MAAMALAVAESFNDGQEARLSRTGEPEQGREAEGYKRSASSAKASGVGPRGSTCFR